MPELAPHPHPDLGGYVLGALEPAERADFEEHLAGCERCQAEVAELRGLPELLEQAAPPVRGAPFVAGAYLRGGGAGGRATAA